MSLAEWQRVELPREIPTEALAPGTRLYISRLSNCQVLVSREADRWHLSISHPFRDPTWQEIKSARYELLPDAARMTMDLPPRAEYVNVHEHCFHLWECWCTTAPASLITLPR